MKHAKLEQANQQWTPREHLPGSEEFTSHPAYEGTERLLTCWTRRNYGAMSDLVSHDAHKRHGKAVRSEIRRAYEDYPLTSFEILAIGHDMPAACTVTARLQRIPGQATTVALRWIREDTDAYPKPEPWQGEWRLLNWEPLAPLRSRSQLKQAMTDHVAVPVSAAVGGETVRAPVCFQRQQRPFSRFRC
ncbi:hypothetical protein [Streptomyces spinosirectus]